MKIRALLADDHKIVREGLRSLLEKQPDIEVIAEAEDGRTALRLAQEMLPDVIIMDVAMPGLNGIESTRQIISKAPGVRVIALSMYSDRRFIMGMLSAGASGYLPKDAAFEELAQAIREVTAGRTYLSSTIVDVMVKNYFHQLKKTDSSAFSVLTNREREVLQLLAEGGPVKEIAQQLCLSVKTIETYRQQIMSKLDIHSVAELTKYAIREGLSTLNNAFSKEELLAWHTRTSKLADGRQFDFTCEHKIDGLAVALTYIDSRLATGATRGDGFRGEEITQNLKTVRSIPLSVPKDVPPRFEVRGEVFLSKSGFRKLNEERAAEGQPLFANPRNAAAGSVRQLDSRITAKRSLDIYIYGLGYAEGKPTPPTHWETMEYLKSIGFKINPNNRRLGTIDQIEEYYRTCMEQRESLPYEADGIVIKINQLDLQKQLGNVGREPRWAIAYKFPAVQGTTQLKEIAISVGRTGTLNPYAILEPVSVGGVTIKQAALHNEDDIRRKDIRIGDTVVIQRAGEVIPEVVGPITNKRTGKEKEFSLLKKIFNKENGRPACPVCGAEVVKPEGEVMYYCSNAACPAQIRERIEHFVSRGGMDIRGIGKSLSTTLYDKGLVKNVADLYNLKNKRKQLIELEGMREKSVDNLLKAIEKSKTRPLARLIYALGIRHVGEETAELLTRRFHSLDELADATREELLSIPAIGPKIADSIIAFFRQEENRRIINRLKEKGVRLAEKAVEPETLPLAGQEFVLTGRLEAFSRQEAEARIKALGGSTRDNITRKTTYLVAGAEPGSKLARARESGIKRLTEEEFIQLLERDF